MRVIDSPSVTENEQVVFYAANEPRSWNRVRVLAGLGYSDHAMALLGLIRKGLVSYDETADLIERTGLPLESFPLDAVSF